MGLLGGIGRKYLPSTNAAPSGGIGRSWGWTRLSPSTVHSTCNVPESTITRKLATQYRPGNYMWARREGAYIESGGRVPGVAGWCAICLLQPAVT